MHVMDADSTSLPLDPLRLEAHADFVRGLARALLRDEASADDVAQETMLAALRRPRALEGSLRAWLGGVVRNLAVRARRSRVRAGRRERAVARPEALAGPDEIAARLEAERRLLDAVGALPEPYRTVVVHRFLDGRSVAAIAAAAGEPEGTVRTRLRRALQHLRARLDEDHGGDGQAWRALLIPLALAGAVQAGRSGLLTGGALSGWTVPLPRISAFVR